LIYRLTPIPEQLWYSIPLLAVIVPVISVYHINKYKYSDFSRQIGDIFLTLLIGIACLIIAFATAMNPHGSHINKSKNCNDQNIVVIALLKMEYEFYIDRGLYLEKIAGGSGGLRIDGPVTRDYNN
jgi:hypothetical protein